MAYAFIQQNAADSAASATTITVTLTPTAGNLLVFSISGDSLDTTSIALSDNLGAHNTFTQIGTDLVTAVDQRCAWWFAANCKGGATTFTATFSGGTRFRTIYVAEYSGIATTSPFLNGARAENDNPGTGADAVSSGNANATSQPALAWGFCNDVNGNTTPSAGTGFTSRAGVWSTATCLGRPEDKRVTATGNVAATFTATTGTDAHGTGIGVFAEAAPALPPLTWAPEFPDRVPARPSVSAFGVAIAPVMAIALTPLCWAPSFPDRAPARPVPNLATGSAVEPVFVPPAAPSVTPMSWSPAYPDQLRRATASPIVGGSFAPEAVLPNPIPSTASWLPAFPDAVPRVRAPLITGGVVEPVVPITNPPASIFPLTVSSNGRYLRKNDGTPFLLCADTTWSLFEDIPLGSVNTYFGTLVSQGFNAVSTNAIEHHYTTVKPPKERGGLLPFTQTMNGASFTGSPNGTTGAAGTQGQFTSDNYSNIGNQAPDPTFINNAYWLATEQILDAALAHNLVVLIWPGYLGFHADDEGWINEMVVWDATIGAGGFTGLGFADPTKSKMWNYGAWMAARWAHYPNIIWVMGGDYGSNTQTLSTAQAAAVSNLMAGLKSVAAAQSLLFTAHWDRPAISGDTTLAAGAFDLQGCYADEAVAELARRGYASTPAKPTIGLEYFYEADLFGGSTPYRKYVYWQFLGGVAGGFYGNEQLWRFDDGTPGTDWTTLLATQARLDAARQFAFWNARPWHRLKPNGLGGMGTLITAGGGTSSPQSTDYVAAAATPEGDLLLAYVPPAHTGTVTVDMTKLGASVTARWFDPANATFTAIGTFANTGTHAFTTPGSNSAGDPDWLLVLEAPDAPMPLSWTPSFPDRAPRLSLTLAQVVSGVVGPVVPPPPATLASWSPAFPDSASRARQPVNAGGSFMPEATLPDAPPLSWSPSFPDRSATPHVRWLHGGVAAPPPDTNGGPLTWLSSFPDRVPGPGRSPAGGSVAPPSDINAGPLTWSPDFPDRVLGPSRAPAGGLAAPPSDTNAGSLTWLPRIPDLVSRPRAQLLGGESAPLFIPAPILPFSWVPEFPDLVPKARQPVNTGGMVKLEATLPNLPAPPMSWLPSFSDFVPPARRPVNVGGAATPEMVLPNPPAPPMSWSPSFPEWQLTRPGWIAWMLDASMTAAMSTGPGAGSSSYPRIPPASGRGVAGVSRGGLVKAGGVSRTGGVRVALPSPTGEWNPQWRDNVVDFDRDAFTRFIEDKGYILTWEKAVLCPNVPGTGLAPRDHVIGCPICGGAGFIYVDAIQTTMLMQGIKLNQSYFAYGQWNAGSMLVTAEPEFTIDYWDRLTLKNGVGRFTQRPVRQLNAVADKLKYAPLCFHYVAWVNRDGALVSFVSDVDFRVSADGSSIEWLGSNQPDAGSFYSVCYDYRPRYVVMDLVHHHRDSTVEGQHYAFPVQAIAKLDFLVRNESADARQVVDQNPFK